MISKLTEYKSNEHFAIGDFCVYPGDKLFIDFDPEKDEGSKGSKSSWSVYMHRQKIGSLSREDLIEIMSMCYQF